MARKIKVNRRFYRPLNGALTDSQFQRLKTGLKSRYRFWIRFPHRETVFWNTRMRAVRVDFLEGITNREHIMDMVAGYIFGFFEALDV